MSATEPATRPSLEGSEWIVVEHLDADAARTPVVEGITATARFADGRVAGTTGCNRYTGAYEAAVDGILAIGPLATTRMACTPEAESVERAVLDALGATAAYAIDGDRLSLTDAGGRVVLVLEASSLTLAGTDWSPIAINNGHGGVASLIIGTRATARFGDDGQLAGFGGCNRIFGPYQADGDAIRIGPLAGGRMFCPEPEGVMEQEAALVAALQSAATWSIDAGRLQLRDGDGALQVDFRPAADEGE